MRTKQCSPCLGSGCETFTFQPAKSADNGAVVSRLGWLESESLASGAKAWRALFRTHSYPGPAYNPCRRCCSANVSAELQHALSRPGPRGEALTQFQKSRKQRFPSRSAAKSCSEK